MQVCIFFFKKKKKENLIFIFKISILVAAEHQKNLRNDMWRTYALQKTVSDPKSPFQLFATGNKQTLETDPAKNGVDVRKQLVDFHDRWYRPSNMRLVSVDFRYYFWVNLCLHQIGL